MGEIHGGRGGRDTRRARWERYTEGEMGEIHGGRGGRDTRRARWERYTEGEVGGCDRCLSVTEEAAWPRAAPQPLETPPSHGADSPRACTHAQRTSLAPAASNCPVGQPGPAGPGCVALSASRPGHGTVTVTVVPSCLMRADPGECPAKALGGSTREAAHFSDLRMMHGPGRGPAAGRPGSCRCSSSRLRTLESISGRASSVRYCTELAALPSH
jgi:hypothetical protein